jgi:rhamnulokinase
MMDKRIHCAAFDLGASGGKVLLSSFNGKRVTVSEVYRFPNNPIRLGNHIYWDFLHLFEEVKKGLQLAHKAAEGRLASIGLDTWGVDCAFLDKKDQLFGNPYSYRDPRTNGIMEKVFQIIPRKEMYERTGVQFMQLNTVFQLYAMMEEDPTALDAIGTIFMLPDLFNFYLTGKKYCEFTNATTTQFYDPFLNEWNRPILTALGIHPDLLAPIIQPATIIGELSPWLCEELGLPPIPVVAVATHDTPSAVSVVPSTDPNYAFLSSGTWSLLGAEEKFPVVNENGLKFNFSSYGGVGRTWLIWKNIQALWLLQECLRVWSEQGKNISYEEIILQANQAKAFCAILDTDDQSFLTPGDMPARIVEFCKKTKQTLPENEGAVARCILESLALKYRYTFEALQQVIGRTLNQLYVIGGGSRNWLLNTFTAEALGLPVHAGPAEATAIGNIMSQLMALDHIHSLEESRSLVRTSFELASFEACRTPGWDSAYERFRKITSLSKTIHE